MKTTLIFVGILIAFLAVIFYPNIYFKDKSILIYNEAIMTNFGHTGV
jgi:hypothetical protein